MTRDTLDLIDRAGKEVLMPDSVAIANDPPAVRVLPVARRDAAQAMVEETIVEELALVDVLVVTDVPELKRYTDPGGAMASAPVARTLDPHLQAAGNDAARVRHIVKDPRYWQPLVDSFDVLLAGARKTVPAAPRASSDGGAAQAAVGADDFDVSSLRSAERPLLAHPDRLLVVTDDQNALSDLYVLGDNGVWVEGPKGGGKSTLANALGGSARSLRGETAKTRRWKRPAAAPG